MLRQNKGINRLIYLFAGILCFFLSFESVKAANYPASDPNIAPCAQNLLNRFQQYKGVYTVMGMQMEGRDLTRNYRSENLIYSKTGKYSGIHGYDVSGTSDYSFSTWQIDLMISEWNTYKIVPTICRHWAPFNYTGNWNTFLATSVDIPTLLRSGSAENAELIKFLDVTAAAMKRLENAGVPVLFRVWHEAWGFWWSNSGGSKNPSAYVDLWRYTWNYLVKTKGVHNCIWVWCTLGAPSNFSPYFFANWYPGDGFVDIIGPDSYQSGPDFSSIYNPSVQISSNKIIALTEFWKYPQPTPFVPFAYEVAWSTPESLQARNTDAYLKSVFTAPTAVTRERMADFINGKLYLPPLQIFVPTMVATIDSPFTSSIITTSNEPATITISGLPSWLSFSGSTSVLSGTPTIANAGSTGTIRVIAKNSFSADTLDYQIIVNLLKNPGFENGSSSWLFANGTYTNAAQHSGRFSAQLASLSSGSGSGLSRTVTGLQPNTSYTISCWASISDTSKSAYLYVKNFGGTEIDAKIKSTDFSQLVITFTTGANSTTADIGVWKPITTANAFCDDFVLLPTDKYVSAKPQVQRFSLQTPKNRSSIKVFNILGREVSGQASSYKLTNGIYFIQSQHSKKCNKMVEINNH